MNIEFWREKYQLLKLAIFNEIYCNQGTFCPDNSSYIFQVIFWPNIPYKVQNLNTNLLAVVHNITLISYDHYEWGGFIFTSKT